MLKAKSDIKPPIAGMRELLPVLDFLRNNATYFFLSKEEDGIKAGASIRYGEYDYPVVFKAETAGHLYDLLRNYQFEINREDPQNGSYIQFEKKQ
jgi:hypothetical protein